MTTEPRATRRRPKNRRAMIAATSAEAFSTLGYHGVSMEEIASQLDISSAALYRHYASKYALFREETLRLSSVCARVVELSVEDQRRPAAERAQLIADAFIGASIVHRRSAALLRWQGRYLREEDRLLLGADLAVVDHTGRALLTELRPDLTESTTVVLSQALFSIISSIGDHHVPLPAKTLRLRLTSACLAVTRCTPPAAAQIEDAAPPRAGEVSIFTPDLLLHRSIELFHERGYPNVSMEDIAEAAGLPAPSAVYRYYRGKSDILTAAFRRAAKRVSDAIGPVVAGSGSPEQALDILIELYVEGSFAERELTFVYYAEIGNVEPGERALLRNIQRLNVEEWAKLLIAARPRLSPAEARLLVHTALALVVDLGRRFGSRHPDCSPTHVAYLMRTVLFHQPRTT
ncbi:TetR/AcrR family transcriptional regulator [Nocardia jejuensis]|uniref:TetR/AcrR family transcriptional regulator n=1 Tax=Nocardia jejuensis TaxID=328049 RepID=UPI0008372CC7|nr:TetR/AcrR family transcriptional regulator [Nocardia jejuensis]